MKAQFTKEEIETLAREIAIMGFELALPDNEYGAYIFTHPEYPEWSMYLWEYQKLPGAHEIMYDLIFEVKDAAIRDHSGWC